MPPLLICCCVAVASAADWTVGPGTSCVSPDGASTLPDFTGTATFVAGSLHMLLITVGDTVIMDLDVVLSAKP